MKKIRDERLQIQNLKNIRIAFIVQTLGIIAILVYLIVTEGIMAATDNPLWLVFLLTMVVLGWLNIRISVDMYDHAQIQKKPTPYYRIIILSVAVGIVIGLLAKFGPDSSTVGEAFLSGGVVFLCFFITFSIAYYMRKKQTEDDDK